MAKGKNEGIIVNALKDHSQNMQLKTNKNCGFKAGSNKKKTEHVVLVVQQMTPTKCRNGEKNQLCNT